MASMRQAAVGVGIRFGVALAAVAVVFAVLGLTPSLSWIPEVPLLVIGIIVPLILLGVAGWRATEHSGHVLEGSKSAALAGAIGGLVGGLCYVAYGKSPLNVVAGALAGAAIGAFVGGLTGLANRLRGG